MRLSGRDFSVRSLVLPPVTSIGLGKTLPKRPGCNQNYRSTVKRAVIQSYTVSYGMIRSQRFLSRNNPPYAIEIFKILKKRKNYCPERSQKCFYFLCYTKFWFYSTDEWYYNCKWFKFQEIMHYYYRSNPIKYSFFSNLTFFRLILSQTEILWLKFFTKNKKKS